MIHSAPNANTNGTSLCGHVEANYDDLVKLFGEPQVGDGHKISTEWVTTLEDQVFTIYDYKNTSLYSECLPTVAELRALPKFAWHIGSHHHEDGEIVIRFKETLTKMIEDLQKNKSSKKTLTTPGLETPEGEKRVAEAIKAQELAILRCANLLGEALPCLRGLFSECKADLDKEDRQEIQDFMKEIQEALDVRAKANNDLVKAAAGK